MIFRILDHFRHELPDGLPEEYLVWDLETTGLANNEDVIREIGYCLAQPGKKPLTKLRVLNWVSHPSVDKFWLADRLACLAQQGVGGNLSLAYLKTGVEPIAALEEARQTICGWADSGRWLVGHNIIRFDLPFLEVAWRRFLGQTQIISRQRVLDTGALYKAAAAGIWPSRSETLYEWQLRVMNARVKGCKWSLDKVVAVEHRLFEKHGLDAAKAHTADFDSLLVRHYLEHVREDHGKIAHGEDAGLVPAAGMEGGRDREVAAAD